MPLVWWQEAFGPSTFFVTEMLLGGAAELTNGALRIPGGMLVRGNLRATREEAFDAAETAIKRMFGARACTTELGFRMLHMAVATLNGCDGILSEVDVVDVVNCHGGRWPVVTPMYSVLIGSEGAD